MATLETQYKNYLNEHPESTFTFEEWKKWLGENLKKELERLDRESEKKENDK